MAWVWADRTGERRLTGHNERGASVELAPVEVDGAFTPGELLGVALAGCAGMSADAAIVRRLGEVPVRVEVDRVKHETEDRYASLAERIVIDLTPLSDEERERLTTVIERALAASCTVGNTLHAPTPTPLTITSP